MMYTDKLWGINNRYLIHCQQTFIIQSRSFPFCGISYSILTKMGCVSSEAERPLVVLSVIASTLLVGFSKLFLVPSSSAAQLMKQRQWYVPSCLWYGAYKILLLIEKCRPWSGGSWSHPWHFINLYSYFKGNVTYIFFYVLFVVYCLFVVVVVFFVFFNIIFFFLLF